VSVGALDEATLAARIARLRAPRGVAELAARLRDAGYETWCVGGAVRDGLLGRPSLDWDLATAATPAEMRRLFRRVVPKGEQFGTLGLFDTDGVMHEVTTFRRDVHTDGRHAVVEFGASLDDDLARRDFTINAIAYDPATGRLHDPFDGVADLRHGVVRAVGDPFARLREDRLRALRAIRFAARFGFAFDPDTWSAIVDSAPHLGRLSAERVREELEKTMRQVRAPSWALERWRESRALATLVPALADASSVAFLTVDQLPMPIGRRAEGRLLNRLAAPWLERDRATAERALRALRCSNQEIRWVADLVERWERVGAEMREALAAEEAPNDAVLRRWAARIGRVLVPALMRLAAARWTAERAAGGERVPEAARVRAVHRRLTRIAYRDPIALGDLAVGGTDLMEAGIAAGPAVGSILQRLLAAVVEDPAENDRERLLARARLLAAGGPATGGGAGSHV
jgi:tRNA nucleotidyltransferase (CCA-adding enzyme)